MKIEDNKIELEKIEDDTAYFYVNDLDYTFEAKFNYSTEVLKGELDYENGTGQVECTEVSFMSVAYVSFLYDSSLNSQGEADVNKTHLENLIQKDLEYILND